MRLIDADALVSEFEWLKSVVCPCNRDEIEDAIRRIKNAPTIDAVPFVRCKDCKYGHLCYPEKRFGEDAKPAYFCDAKEKIVSVDGYCIYGERKDGADNE